MKAVLGVARFELRRLQRSLLIFLSLLLLVSGLALYSGAIQLRHQQTNAQLISSQQQDYLDKQLKKVKKRIKELKSQNKPLSPDRKIYRNPAYLAQHGTPAILEQGPLALVSVGLTPLQPQSTQVSLSDPALAESQENLQHPLQLWTGHFDLVFVLVYLLPLLLIALSFDLTASEQQSGNLKLLLVQGGGLQSLIVGKLLARGLILLGMLGLISLMLALAAAWLQQPIAWGRWGLILLWSLAYGSIWLGLAACLNALRWSAANIAATLAALWLLGIWVIPGSSQQLVQSLVEVPSRMSYVQSFREASEKVRQQSSRLLGKYMEDHPELAGGADNRYAMLQLSKEQALAQAIGPVVANYQQQLHRQQQLARWMQYLSPVTVFESSLNQIAGSGLERQQDYSSQLTSLQAQWEQYFLPLIRSNQALQAEQFSSHPRFAYHELSLSRLLPALVPQGLFLGLLALLLLGWSLQSYKRYQIIETEQG